MSGHGRETGGHSGKDKAPGDDARDGIVKPLVNYAIGFILAIGLTAASFLVLRSQAIYAPAIPVALIVLAIAQMGVHLVFFLHLTTGPDNTNNVMALAFGVLIVGLVVVGSIVIVSNLDSEMAPMHPTSRMTMGLR